MIQNLDELERLLKLLRSHGVYTFKWSGLEFLISDQIDFQSPRDLLKDPDLPTQAELDAAVGLPVGDIDDPFIDYNSQQVVDDENPEG